MNIVTKPGSLDVNAMLSRIDPMQCNQVVKDAQNSGTPLFTVNDLRTTTHPLAQIVRLLLIRNNITREKFEALHRKMGMQTYMSANNMNYERNNMRRALAQGDITWNFLEKLLVVCGFDLTDVTLTLSNRETGEITTISRSDVQDLIKDNPYHPSIILNRVDKVTE